VTGPGLALGVALPQTFAPGGVDVAGLPEYVRRAEALGFRDLWASEILYSAAPGLDGLDLLAHVAALTRTAGLGIATLVLPRHDPAILAKRLATIDHLSGGRLIAGIAVGDREGPPRERPGDRLAESLARMRALWRDGAVDGARMEPRPLQAPLPVWFGGRHPRALRRAAELGDGWIGAGSTSDEEFVAHARTLREELERAGRDPATFPISKRVYIAVSDDPRRDRRRIAEYFEAFYGSIAPDDPATRVAVVGSVEECSERLAAMRAADPDHLLLHPLFDELEQLEPLAELGGLR
jgi:alkanesulfonate monooxygenase SsuD/methylene tetrahydromethanopterin reductase-like flavin-dependent oxidoreductase (luciferase family)